MNKRLKIASVGAILLACGFFSSAQISRQSDNNGQTSIRTEVRRGVKLSPEMMPKQRATDEQRQTDVFPSLEAKVKTPRRSVSASAGTPLPAKAASNATTLQGYCSYTGSTSDIGWQTINKDLSSTLNWKTPTQYRPSTGFVRGDEIYAFYTYSTSASGLTDAGYYIQDLATGEVKKQVTASIFDTLEEVVRAAAYDSAEDMAYVITYNATGNGYLLRTFDPKTGKFNSLGVNAPSDWLELGWNPADNSLYLFDEGGLLKKYDAKAKRFNQTNALPYEIIDYTQCMIYSPKDNAFIIPVDIYNESDEEVTGLFLLPASGNYTYLGTFENSPQYAILHTTDTYINADGPKAPVLKSWNVKVGSTQGNFVVTLPSKYENGTSITGKVYLQVTIDGNSIAGSYNGIAGSDVTIPVNASEGLHHFAVTPYTLGDDGKVLGTSLLFDRALGADTPKAPTNVKLTERTVSWNAVTEGANGGSIDASAVTYNVYIDKVLMTPTPVKATSISITLPASGYVAHRAEVYAICGGKTSNPGVSDKLYAEGALSLPVFLAPEPGETEMDDELIAMFTPVKDMMNTESLRGWRYDDQNEHTGGFYCLSANASSAGSVNNEWLFLPAINFDNKGSHYRLTMDVWTGNHFFTADEIYEIALCKRPTASRPTVIREATTVYKNANFETSETLFEVPEEGEWYIGIHYISPIGAYRLYARNFRIEAVNATSDSPAAVTELKATAAERGELAAIVSFNMPSVSISGSKLDPATTITADVESEAGTATATGKPGQSVSVKVAALQGNNTIKVKTSSDKGIGSLAETTVYCGVYRPATPYVTTVVSDDNTQLTIEIELDDYNENGEFTGPDLSDVQIYRKIGDEWRVAADIGKKRTWSFTAPDASKQDMYTFGVGVKNAAGSAEVLNTFMVHLGKLFTLPMNEPFNTNGDNVDVKYEPVTIEHLSYLQTTWGFADPRLVDEAAANTSGNAICATWDGESQLVLPRFTTKGLDNVKLDLGLYFGNLAPSMVTVYATTPVIEMEPVATFTPESSNQIWDHKLVSLPAMCQNQAWVQIIIRVKIEGYTQYFMMESYSIADYPDDMMTITSFSGPGRAAVGETLSYAVEIENSGTAEAALPAYTFKATGANGTVADLKDADAPKTIAAGKKATLRFDVTPKAADKGNMTINFNIEGQPLQAVSAVEKNVVVLNAPIPVVDDLAYSVENGNVNLTWSEPSFVESFEACEEWDMTENIKGFRNLDLDGGREYGIGEVNFPGKGAPKGFQVFTSTITDNPMFKAHTGSQYLICISSSSVASDDWLISPEIKGGSAMSFWMNIFSSDYPETVLVMYSTTGNDPKDFTKMLDNGYVCPDEFGWNKYEFTLPADARYFALHHVADDPAAAFGFMLDDIAYEAAKPTVTLDGYNVYRDNDVAASMLKTPGFTDLKVDLSAPVRYYIMSAGTVNGESVESDRSNVIWVEGEAGIEDISADSAGTITAADGAIVLNGFAQGEVFTIVNMAGVTIANGTIESDNVRVAVSQGVYMVNCNGAVAKLFVR